MRTRIILSGCLIIAFASFAQAEITISWGTIANMLQDSVSADLPGVSVFAGYLSPDASTSGFDATTTGWNNPTGGDTFLGYWQLNTFGVDTGRIISMTTYHGVGSSGLDGEYVYMALFDIPSNTLSTASDIMPEGTDYTLGPVSSFTTTEFYLQTPGSDDYGAEVDGVGPLSTGSQIAAVPEPGSISLMLLGLSVVGLRKKFRRK